VESLEEGVKQKEILYYRGIERERERERVSERERVRKNEREREV